MVGLRKSVYVLNGSECNEVENAVNEMYGVTDWDDEMSVNFLQDALCEQDYGCDCYVTLNIEEDEVQEAKEYADGPYGDSHAVRRYRILRYLRDNVPADVDSILVEVSY